MAGLLIALFLLLSFERPDPAATAPQVPVNQYGLAVVTEPRAYQALASSDHRRYLVDLGRFVPGLRVELAYAGTKNVTGRRLYDAARAYATLAAAERLRAVQRQLAAEDLGLMVWDAYRPYTATLALWRAVRDRRYAAPPSSGSLHNRGCALDLTLVHAGGRELPMPTAFDVLAPRAGHAYPHLPAPVQKRRGQLRVALERHGFEALDTEWWHYQQPGFGLPLPLDVPLADLATVPLPVDVWLRYPPAARLLVLAERWALLAKRA